MAAGASFTGLTVIVNVCVADSLIPPLSIPPLSVIFTVIVATPLALGAGVYIRFPFESMYGCTVNRELLLLVATNSTACNDSFEGPLLILVAHPFTVIGPLSSFTVWFAPFVKEGASLTGLTVTTILAGFDK